MKVFVLVMDGVFDTGLSIVLDTLATANELGAASGKARLYDVRVCGLRRQVTTQQGFRVPSERVESSERPDLVIAPALGPKTPDLLEAALERSDVREASDILRLWHRQGARITGACTATFVLAQAGMQSKVGAEAHANP
jgi:transcriptional regulator GlxA family with amidase domain